MKTVIHPSSARGKVDFGWLNSRHSFSFGHWHDPEKVHFGALRVLNDDIVKGGAGFGEHPHDNMEIISIPLTGSLAHKDSTGTDGIIQPGDIQIMSAGTGIRHSEYNASKTEPVNFLQVWIIPKKEDIQPRYDQRHFEAAAQANQWQVVISPDASENAMWINQDARFSLSELQAGKVIDYAVKFPDNGVYIFVIEGAVEIDNNTIAKRDAIGVYSTSRFSIRATQDSRLLAIEVPMLS